MTFLEPVFLWLVLLVVPFLFFNKKSLQLKIHVLILLLLLLALSRPILKHSTQETLVHAKDVIIAVDVSFSMQANDISPSRFTFAKETIKHLLTLSTSDNIMLMAFTTNPLLLSPPTTDHALIRIALESLNPHFILTKGTSLKRLFEKLSTMQTGHKNLILITDGGEEQEVDNLTTLVNNSNVSLTLLALGTTKGTTIQSKRGSFLKNKEGNLVVTRINPMLKTLVSSVDGNYFTASSSSKFTAQKLYDSVLAKHQNTQQVKKNQHQYIELFQIPLGLALLLFFIVHTHISKYIILLFGLFGTQSHASLQDSYYLSQAYVQYNAKEYNATLHTLKKIKVPSLQSHMLLGNTLYKQKRFLKAIKVYRSIQSTSSKIKQQLFYNIANAYASKSDYTKAKMYYAKSLQLGLDNDAKHNLSLVSLLYDKKKSTLGIAHPKSQDTSSSKGDAQSKEKKQNEDTPSSSSGGGGTGDNNQKEEESKLRSDNTQQKHPLSSKVYELINKGYIHEPQPW